MASKIALLFPGQGSQAPGMGKLLYDEFPEAREIFDQANEILRVDIKSKIFQGSEEDLRQTAVTQPAIFTVSCAAFQVLSKQFPSLEGRCSFAAGHSLGEYSALFCAQVFNFQTGLKLVSYRGQFIQSACEKNPGTMAAMIGFGKETLRKLCQESADGNGICEMVNFNCPGQAVVAGTQRAVQVLLQKASGVQGTKAVALNVSGAFHSSLMREASQKMSEILEKSSLNDSRIPVVANCDAQPTTQAQKIREKLVRQIDHPVLWEDSIRWMIAQGAETFVEVGPGKVLGGLLRKIDRKKKVLNVEDPQSLEKTLQELG